MIGSDWTTDAFAQPPVAPHTGVFPGRDFLRTWWMHRAGPDDVLLLVESESALLPTMESNRLVTFVGEPDLTDYHSPLGTGFGALVAELADTAPGTPFRFDSLPTEAAEPLATALSEVAEEVETVRHETTGVLDLPATFDDYLAGLGKKDRHEVRRKRRRFTESLGEPRLRRIDGPDAVADFAAMHTMATGDKGSFFVAPRLPFFQALHAQAGAVVDVLAGDDGRPLATAFGFEDADGYYLYNTAYHPDVGMASPGVVLVSLLIEQAIGMGGTVFDFLKGDETYKRRLGAQQRPLFVVTGRFDAGGG